MASKLSQGELLQIFGIVVAIGRSEHYSITFDYDSEWNSVELRLFYSSCNEDVSIDSMISDRTSSFAEILGILKNWTKIIVADRGVGVKEEG